MKYEDLKDLKPGDKVVVEVANVDKEDPKYPMGIKSPDLISYISNDAVLSVYHEPAKIKMTVEEKKEFDELKKKYITPYAIMFNISYDETPNLYTRMSFHGEHRKEAKRQIEFVKAIEHPDLIEVVHEDVRTVKIAGLYLFKFRDEKANPFLTDAFDINNEGYYFTKSAIENINKEDKFKNVDLVSAWEDGK